MLLVFVPLVLFVDSAFLFAGLIVAAAWMFLYMPFWRRRVRHAAATRRGGSSARNDAPAASSSSGSSRPCAACEHAERPVLLATLEAPLTAEASTFAVDAAVESGQPLLVVNAVESSLQPCGLVLGYDTIVPPDVEESLRAPADLAHSLGVAVERLRLRSPRPLDALLELVAERSPGLLVLGPDPHGSARAGSARRRGGSSARPAASSGSATD